MLKLNPCRTQRSDNEALGHHRSRSSCSSALLSPSPPAEKATTCEDQAGQASTGDGAGDGNQREGADAEPEGSPLAIGIAARHLSRGEEAEDIIDSLALGHR